MPSSQNRRRIELPADLYDQLADRAADDRTTVAALAARLLHEALVSPATHSELRLQRAMLGSVQQQLSAIHERLDSLHTLAPRTEIDRPFRLPLTMRPEMLERARQELLDDLRRDRRRGQRDASDEGGQS